MRRHSGVSMMVADDLAPNWRQNVCNPFKEVDYA